MKKTKKSQTPRASKQIVFNVEAPTTLMEFLMKKMDGISRTKVKRLLVNGMISVEGVRNSQFDYPLLKGMIVEIGKPTAQEKFSNPWIKIVYEDKYLVVVNKKAGILTNSPTKDNETVQSLLNEYFVKTRQKCRAHTIHRLDRDTSGLLLFAKDKKIAMMFEEDWKEKVYDRRYVAVVAGEMEQKSGTIQSWLKDNKMFVTFSSPTDNGGKLAITHYETVMVKNGYSLLELKLETGRKNQIRVHLQDLHHPVIGDLKYGNGDNCLGRLALHAFKLCFIHPITGEDKQFETPYPSIFEKVFLDKK